ncbi:MAG: hypothetical protein KTR30_36495 [Saprospiraceae bacterium]|nr:hypothetical protein [Saprospiraceae bacterium]
MAHLENIVMGIALSSTLIFVTYFITKYNYLLKKALLDRGEYERFARRKIRFLELGCLMVGLGFGLGFSSFFYVAGGQWTVLAELMSYVFPLIFGGTGLLAAYFIRRKFEGNA